MFKADIEKDNKIDQVTKEVQRYAEALNKGFNQVKKENLLTVHHIKAIQQVLENNEAGLCTLPETKLKNPATEEIVFIPPQNIDTIKKGLANLESYINDDTISAVIIS